MAELDPTGTDWTDREVDLIVADYFNMLSMELSGKSYVKAQRNSTLQALTGRSRGSIEYKHQNISAILFKLGQPWIPGYKPMWNYQRSLTDGIDRFLSENKFDFNDLLSPPAEGLAEETALLLESPPALKIEEANDPPNLKRLIRKFDSARRDARNRVLGENGEQRIYQFGQSRLRQAGREDLARKVRWVSQVDGDGAGYDILSYDFSGKERLLEVKTTAGHQTTPFYLSENERVLSMERPEEFRLVRLYDFLRKPKAFELIPPLEDSVMLRANSYRASFDS